jgi:YD repeat-containing protein
VVFAGFVTDSTGARHALSLDPNDNSLRTNDGSGYMQSSTLASTVIPLKDSSGNTYAQTNGTYSIIDPNGNAIQRQNIYWSGNIVDSVGRTIPDINSLTMTSSTTGCPTLNIPNEPLIGSAKWSVPSLNGLSETYLFCYTQVSISTNFSGPSYISPTGNGGQLEASGTVNDIQSVVLPDGTYWSFVYDTTSSTQPYAYGDLLAITYPTGGSISYQYTNVNSYIPAGGLTRGVTSRTISDMNGNVGTWTYSPGAVATVTDPANNDTVFTYDQSNSEGSVPVEVDRKYYQGKASTNVVLKDVATQYIWIQDPGSKATATTNYLPHIVTTTTPAGSMTSTVGYDVQSQNEYYLCWDDLLNGQLSDCSSSNLEAIMFQMPTSTTVKNYDGTLLKSTSTKRQANPTGSTTQPLTNPYYQANLLGLVSNTTSSDSASSYEKSYGYDEATLGPSCYCGNQTSHSDVDVTSTVSPNRWTILYNASGMPTTMTDANTNAGTGYPGGAASYTYDSLGLFVSNINYPTTGGVSHSTSQVQDDTTGLIESSTDQNKQSTKYFYYSAGQAYANRIQLVEFADGGSINFGYSNEPGASSVTATSVTNTASDTTSIQTTIVDGVGRVIHKKRNDSYCSIGAITVDTVYDSMGRISAKSGPYCLNSDPTYNLTSYQYDALGRVILESHTDGTSRQWCYDGQQIIKAQTICEPNQVTGVAGDWTDFADESGIHHQYVNDGLGRLVAVSEPPVVAGGGRLTTTYSYNALDLLTGVQQGQGAGSMQRTFKYDQFGRLNSATNPESSLITYSLYDPNGNSISKTDTRGVITTYAYDALNRLVSKTYSGSNSAAQSVAATTMSACFQYDTNALTNSGGNLLGRLTNEWTILGTCSGSVPSSGYQSLHSVLTYDQIGRVQTESQCTPANCSSGAPYSLSYSYDYAGNLTMYTNGIGTIGFTQQYDGANRLLNITSTWNDSTHPSGLFNVESYNPFAIAQFTMGNGISVQRTYDSRMRITGETAVGSN